MKTILNVVALVLGLIVIACGNSWGLLGLIPAFIQMVKVDFKGETIG